eukprot:12057719-Alexandrium_andersonii.AAC.1
MRKRRDFSPARPSWPLPTPIEGNCWQGGLPATNNRAFGGRRSTTLRSSAPRLPSKPQTFPANRRT